MSWWTLGVSVTQQCKAKLKLLSVNWFAVISLILLPETAKVEEHLWILSA